MSKKKPSAVAEILCDDCGSAIPVPITFESRQTVYAKEAHVSVALEDQEAAIAAFVAHVEADPEHHPSYIESIQE